MKRLLMATMALAVAGGAAYAGPNAGGTLILSSNPSIVYCSDNTTYCGQSGLTACEAASNHTQGADPVVFFAIAAFSSTSSPRLAALTFGVNYPTAVTLIAQGSCADFELATGSWPASGEGTAITWNTARTTQLVEAYWFAGYNYYSPDAAVFQLGPHPTQSGQFADDSVPANVDAIAGYGSFGFDAPGATPCPTGVSHQGACCLPNFGPCVVSTPDDCAAQGGTYLGDDSPCDPNPCPVAPLTGACCVAGAACFITDQAACEGQGGTYQGDNTTCSPDPCAPPVATIKSTWGQIKANNR